MKIRKIHLENNYILGTITFDFTDDAGKVIDNIIIAGENGTGKTALLDIIYQFTNYSLDNKQRNENRCFEIEFNDSEIHRFLKNSNVLIYLTETISDNIFKVYFNYNIINNWDQIQIEINTGSGKKIVSGAVFQFEPAILKALFSDAEINYVPKQIENVTARNIDTLNIRSEKSSINLATEITQLLIDIQSLDSQDFANWGKANVGKPVDETKLDNRLKRFTSAFNFMFPTKRFKHIDNVQSHKSIIFTENEKEMSIEKLSSGEKQIEIRGSFLLKDIKSNNGALILIDEPEISLHPTWQIKILDYYKRLFINDNVQTSQIIVTTHSPFIIHNSSRSNDKVIILKRDEAHKVYIPEVQKFQNWTDEVIVKEAFNVDYFTHSRFNMVLLEGETDEMYFRKAIEVYGRQDVNLEFNWIGRTNHKGHVEFTGDSALNQTKNFLVSNPVFLNKEVILLYDSDTNKPVENLDKLKVRIMPKNESNIIYKIGVENLLNLPYDFNKDDFYKSSKRTDNYGAESIIKELDKTKLSRWVCNELEEEKQKIILLNINNLISELIAN